jgi:hypothetical protein
LLAFQGSVAQNAVLANVPLLTDTVFANQSGGYLPPFSCKALAGYGRTPDASLGRLDTPNLRIPVYPYMSELDLASDPPNLPPVNLWWDNGPPILQNDQTNFVVSRAGAGAADCTGLFWVGKETPGKARGDIRTIRATASITRVANQWVEGSLTLTDTLPSGRYAVVGAVFLGTNLLAGRFIFPDRVMRPGTIAQQALGEYGWDQFRWGNMGTWGEFESTAVPTIQIIGYGANTSQTVYIDVIKIR